MSCKHGNWDCEVCEEIDAAIASLSAPQPPAEAQAVGDCGEAGHDEGRCGNASCAPPSAPVGVEGLSADLEIIWHSVSDDKETNAAYQRLKAALAQQPAAVDELRDSAKALYNATIADPEVKVSCPTPEKRDAVDAASKRLRAALAGQQGGRSDD